ncbi:peptide deformylase [Deferribacter abyssi]|uniref:peptide deformylase n=1 Tax=Deferribacter abyssi TaxID=213806 RepID=UPI003C2784CF
MVLKILKFPNPILRKKSVEVKNIDSRIVELLNNMAETMYAAPGVGLAAPQVGVNERLLVINPTAGEDKNQLIKIINPVIVDAEGEVIEEEGCLSIPGEYANVRRAAKVLIRGLDENGNELEIEAEDLLARVFQHEIDHLNGVLFLDRLSPTKRETIHKHIKKRIAAGDYIID